MSATLIRYRDATTTSNFVYLRGEPIYDSDTGEFAVGDGVTAWSGLPKFTMGGGAAWGGITGTLSDQTDLQSALDAKLAASSVSGFGATLINDADAAAARTTLGLGSAATSAASAFESAWTYATLGSDFTTSSATAVDITGLSFTPAANTNYEFEARLFVRTATGAIIPRPGLTWPTGLNEGVARLFVSNTVAGEIVAHGNSAAAMLCGVGGLSSTTTSYMGGGQGFIYAGASPSGNIQMQLASETGGTDVKAMQRSFLRWRVIP